VRAARALTALAVAGGAAAAAAGCCAGPEYRLVAFDPRGGLEARDGYALLAPVVDDPGGWAYADAAPVASALAAHYRPPPDLAPSPAAVAPIASATGPLGAALRAAEAAVVERGYRPVGAGEEPGLVVSVAIRTREGAALDRVAVHVGGRLDGRFRRDLLALAAALPEGEGACPVDPAEVVTELLSVLPEREAE